MASRKSTPDILGSVMDGTLRKEENHKPIKQELKKEAILPSTQPDKKLLNDFSSALPIKDEREGFIGIEELKEKTTLMLSVQLLNTLEEKWMELRKLIGSKQVSKSLIAQISIEIALQDFEKNKESSRLFSLLLNSQSIKQ